MGEGKEPGRERKLEQRIIAEYLRVISPELIALGELKFQQEYRAQTPEEKNALKAKMKEIDARTQEKAYQLLQQAKGTSLERRVITFFDLVKKYVAEECSLDEIRAFVADNYTVSVVGKERMQQELVPGEKTLIILNHYRQGPELNGLPSHGLGQELAEHDVAPIMAKLFTDRALEGTGIDVCRFGKPLYPNDPFYYRSQEDARTAKISDKGVEGLADQFKETWSAQRFPTVCPEAGLRSLNKWRTGSLTSAVLAGAESIALLAQSPWLSTFDNKVQFDYVGKFQIPPTVRREVETREDTAALTAFSNLLRRRIAGTVVDANYDPAYTRSVKHFLDVEEEEKQ